MAAVSIFHVVAKRARFGDDKMRCEFLLILCLICRLLLPSSRRPKVLKRLRDEWQKAKEREEGRGWAQEFAHPRWREGEDVQGKGKGGGIRLTKAMSHDLPQPGLAST